MATLKTLIPNQFYIKPPATQDPANGRLSITQDGKIFAEWDRKSNCFNENLAAARELKTAGYGTYRPDAGGWIFHRNAAENANNKFPDTLLRTPEFLALVNELDGKILTDRPQPQPQNKKHGRVKLQGNQFLVQWGGESGICPREYFERYLAFARSLKEQYSNSNGWNKPLAGWLISRTAATTIIKKFPAINFDHCPELATAALEFPEPEPEPNNIAPTEYTLALLAAAEQVFSTFA
jgi:hypothetical protein